MNPSLIPLLHVDVDPLLPLYTIQIHNYINELYHKTLLIEIEEKKNWNVISFTVMHFSLKLLHWILFYLTNWVAYRCISFCLKPSIDSFFLDSFNRKFVGDFNFKIYRKKLMKFSNCVQSIPNAQLILNTFFYGYSFVKIVLH